jgi:hypothetical protein
VRRQPHSASDLSCRKTGGDGNPFTYTKVTFGDIVISSFQTGGSNGSSILPMEQIRSTLRTSRFEYFQQKSDGSVALTNTPATTSRKSKAPAPNFRNVEDLSAACPLGGGRTFKEIKKFFVPPSFPKWRYIFLFLIFL